MIQKSAMVGLTRPQALFRFNQARTMPGAVVEMLEQADGNWTVTIVWDESGAGLSREDLQAFESASEGPEEPEQLGALSRKFESNGNPGAIGFDTMGGYSYGSYQIASKVGRMKQFIDFLSVHRPALAVALESAGGDEAAKAGSDAFRAAWRTLAIDPTFAAAQHDFIEESHYKPFKRQLLETLGLDLNARSKTLRDVAWSISVQHGPGSQIFARALEGQAVGQLTDAEVIAKVYAERRKTEKYFASSTEAVRIAVAARFAQEESRALQQLQANFA
jgi:hypothetical protein